ncbi:MAG TPA: Rossmann-like and DUF2520 domain-containing protein [Candidatus Dormibacteraeota bacterium]|nr:Rossmann-like and DUF2520 domain-containing protein [Candidatus Dormibacteraeota bacterium]
MPARTGFRLPRDGILFLAVPDSAVPEMAARIAAMRPPVGLSVVHLSGALGLEALAPVAAAGSFHPLQSFPFPRPPEAFRGITIAVDATVSPLRRRLEALARALGATPRRVTSDQRAVYHAAAVFASNFVDVVIEEAVRMLMGIGWTQKEAETALMPLVEGAVNNIKDHGVVGALTGPIRRGDADTVRRHLEVVDEPDLYRMLGLVALRIATEAGLAPEAAERTRRALTRNVAATRRRRS